MLGMLTDDLFEQLKRGYRRPSLLRDELIVDVDLTAEQALESEVVPEAFRDEHAFRAPELTVVPVLYHGLETSPQIHFGQLVVVDVMARTVESLFKALFRSRFGIGSVVPASEFAYDPQAITAANATTAYRLNNRPSGALTEHAKGWAVDFNPLLNMVLIHRDGRTIREPENGLYRPELPGAIGRNSIVHKHFAAHEFEWGGNWGDPMAVPAEEYYRYGHFIYRHIEPNDVLRSRLKNRLPKEW